MDSLLKLAIEAHSGLNAWNELQNLHANVSIGGAHWDLKQLPGLFKNIRVELAGEIHPTSSPGRVPGSRCDFQLLHLARAQAIAKVAEAASIEKGSLY